MIINGLDGEYTVTAEAIGNNGKTYSERLWIPGNQRKEIIKQGMNTIFKTEEGKIIFRYLKKDQENKPQPKPKLDKNNLNNKLKEVEELLKDKTVEGYWSIDCFNKLALINHLEAPILSGLYKTFYENYPLDFAVKDLITRKLKEE